MTLRASLYYHGLEEKKYKLPACKGQKAALGLIKEAHKQFNSLWALSSEREILQQAAEKVYAWTASFPQWLNRLLKNLGLYQGTTLVVPQLLETMMGFSP